MVQLEYAILTVVWNTILQRFNACSKALQSISIELPTAVTLYESFLVFIRSVRDNFDEYEKLAIDLVNCVNGNASCRGETKRRKLRKVFWWIEHDHSDHYTTAMHSGDILCHYSLLVALQKRKLAYMMPPVNGRFRYWSGLKIITALQWGKNDYVPRQRWRSNQMFWSCLILTTWLPSLLILTQARE